MGKKAKQARKIARAQQNKHISSTSSKKQQRADQMLYQAGLARTIAHAQALIMAGEMIANDHRVEKAGQLIDLSAQVRLRPRRKHNFVGRGGLKMQGILQDLHLNVKDWICLDLGMSTGGFTDCLLQQEARYVFGVDVGKGLAHQKLVQDVRVKIIEDRHVKDLTSQDVDHPCDLCVADISFNALHRIVPYALPFLKDNAHLLLLVKPQFELSQARLQNVAVAGIVQDKSAQEDACQQVKIALEDLGLSVWHILPCRTKGTKGNQEYFIYAGMPLAQNLAQITPNMR